MAEWPEPGGQRGLMLEGPAGMLEVLAETPQSDARGLLLVCHPHPRFGGTMNNKVVHTLARAGLSADWAVLRFNFRGVGRSEGSFADGKGELADAAAVLDWGRQRAPGALALAGFSFGAAIALLLSEQVSPDRLVTIAPPLRYFSELEWGRETLPQPDCPWLVVHGDEDDVVDCQDTLQRLQESEKQPQVEVMAGAGHFFHGRLTELRQIVEPFLAS